MFPRRVETVLPIIKYNQNGRSTCRIYKLAAACMSLIDSNENNWPLSLMMSSHFML